MKIAAFYIAEQLQLKRLKEAYAGTLLSGNVSELFYRVDEDRYLYAFDYGAVVFANMDDTDVSKNLALLQQFSEHPLSETLREDFEIFHQPEDQLSIGFDSLTAPQLTGDVVKITMLNTAHSVALDFYSQRAHELLSEIQRFTGEMENEGSSSISRKNMLRFIGRMLNSKNRIVENPSFSTAPTSLGTTNTSTESIAAWRAPSRRKPVSKKSNTPSKSWKTTSPCSANSTSTARAANSNGLSSPSSASRFLT